MYFNDKNGLINDNKLNNLLNLENDMVMVRLSSEKEKLFYYQKRIRIHWTAMKLCLKEL
ncbi:hypothetical protein JTS93_12325 [Clostridium botulinum]|nr:hypothetical protein [Clostridium botulinum]